jgi:hypothetical protein
LVSHPTAINLAFIPHQIKDYDVGIPAELANSYHLLPNLARNSIEKNHKKCPNFWGIQEEKDRSLSD